MNRPSYRVAVVGATGAVGSTVLEVLAERDFPVAELVPFASERSLGTKVRFGDQKLGCQVLSKDVLDGFDLVISSAGGSVAREWAPLFAQAGALVIDKSSVWRTHEAVPLVVSEVNPEAVNDALSGPAPGIIASPNCSTMQLVVALKPILDAVGIERLVISTYQSVSGTGGHAVEELRDQASAWVGKKDLPSPTVYPHQIAFNVLPQVETFQDGDDYTTEETKIMRETLKIFGDESIRITATCARVPVEIGHSESVNVETRDPLSADACRELLGQAKGVLVVDDPANAIYPLAIDAAGRDEVLVGRIREDQSHERCLNMWIVGDNLRKGAATNAVQIAEVLDERGLLKADARSGVAAAV